MLTEEEQGMVNRLARVIEIGRGGAGTAILSSLGPLIESIATRIANEKITELMRHQFDRDVSL